MTTQPSPAIPENHLVAIAAAVHVCVRGPHAIRGISETHAEESQNADMLAWSVEGRRGIFTSHKIR